MYFINDMINKVEFCFRAISAFAYIFALNQSDDTKFFLFLARTSY